MIAGQSEEIRQVVQAIFTATPEPKAVPPVGTKEWEIFAQEFCDDLFAEESPPSEAYAELEKKLAEGTAKIKFDAEGCFTVDAGRRTMLDGWPILRAVGKALVVRGGKFLLNAVSGGVLGEAVDVVQYAWEEWQRAAATEEVRQASLQALAQAPIQEVRKHAAEIAQEVAAEQPDAVRQNLVNYLTHVPATVRRSLRRASDLSGTTIPAGLVLRKADDLLALLPPRLPRFKEGDFPLANVDLELVELLGVGGFGEVWEARNPYQQNDPPVALKFCIDADAASSLRHEAALLDRVKSQGTHAGIVRLLRTYLRADPPCLEYEYVAGGDLGGLIQEWHRTEGRVRADKAAKVMLRLAEIVGFAHRLNPPIVHRDLKPANILVQKKDKGIVLKVADFGIGGVAVGRLVTESRGDSTKALLAATVARGSYTALYASPQQMAGLPADPRDDVYALGVIWHQLLTGDLAKGRPGGSRWRERLTDKGLSATMVKLLEDCFEDDPEDRPKDAADLAARLAGLMTPTPAIPLPKQKEPSPPPNVPVVPPATRTEGQDEPTAQTLQTVSPIEAWNRLVHDTCDSFSEVELPSAEVQPEEGEDNWQRGGQSQKPCCPECGYLDYNPAQPCGGCGHVAETHSKPQPKRRFGWFK